MLAARQAFRSTLPRAVLLRQTAASHRLPTNAISVATLPRLVDAWRSSHSRRTFAVASKQQENTKEGDSSKAETAPDKEKKPSLEEAVHRIQGDDAKKGTSASSTGGGIPTDDLLRSAADYWSSFQTEVGQTWQDLISSEERRSINKKIRPVATAEGDAPYAGPVEVMVIDPSEHLTAWERMQRRLTDAPVIQDVLARTEEFYEKSGARKVKDRVDEVTEDAREAWETSQNPWVYRMSSVYDTLTAETPESIAVKELRQLDPEFTLDDWRRNVVEHTLPQIMQWFLEGRINQLKDWLGEGVFKRIAAEITARKQEGVEIDTHVLSIMNSEILAIEPDEVNKGSPIIVLHFMVQQINCVRKKSDGSIVEGSEDDIKANSYVCAFQREFHEELGELQWKVVDFRFNGAIAYL